MSFTVSFPTDQWENPKKNELTAISDNKNKNNTHTTYWPKQNGGRVEPGSSCWQAHRPV